MKKLLFAVVLLGTITASQATTLFEFDNVASFPGGTPTVRYNGWDGLNVDIKIDGDFREGQATGAMYFDVNGTERTFMCVELDQSVSSDPKTYSRYTPIGRIGVLANMIDAMDTDVKRAGLQLAIWETAYDFTNGNPDNLGSGRFRAYATNNATQQALQWANTVLGQIGNAKGTYEYFRHSHKQDQIGAVPEPASLACLGLGAVALLRRKFRKSA